jgi:glycerol uptake facilitator-like aquaporin
MQLPFLHRDPAFVPARLVAELLAVFCLTLGVSVSLAALKEATPLVAALTVGLFVYTIGPVSGAHINPAVTIGLASVGKIAWKEALWYIGAQVVGALLAMLAVSAVADVPDPNVTDELTVVAGEMVGAFVLVFGVSAVAYGKVNAGASGAVVGLSLLLGIALAVLSGFSAGVLNPAVALGIGTVSVFYLVAPLVGGVLAAQLYRWLVKG